MADRKEQKERVEIARDLERTPVTPQERAESSKVFHDIVRRGHDRENDPQKGR